MRNDNSKLKEGLIRFLTVSGDLMILNFLWLVCSIPIITIGPATCATFDVTLRLAKGETVPVLKSYFKAFKVNFKQALIIGLFLILGIFSILVDIDYALGVEGTMQKIYIVVSIIAFGVETILITYGNGLIVSYNNTLKAHVINAFKLAFINPIATLLMMLIVLAPLAMALFIQPIILLYIGWFIILYLVSLPIYLCSLLLNKVFVAFNEER